MQQDLARAIQLAIEQKWEDAHALVADMEHPIAYWLHAVLHKIEGDISNADYWYRRARRSDAGLETTVELEQIREALTQ